LGCFFSGTSGTVVVVGVKRLFAFERWRSSLQPQWSDSGMRIAMCYSAVDCKKCDRKKQQKGWRGEWL